MRKGKKSRERDGSHTKEKEEVSPKAYVALTTSRKEKGKILCKGKRVRKRE